jgi:hypothetical protein
MMSGMTDAAPAYELNLRTHRAAVSVWNRRGWDGSRERLTIARWLIGAGGGVLAIEGLRRRSLPGGVLAGLGGTVAWWALSGEGDLSDGRRWIEQWVERMSGRRDDQVHEASADSFPASDAPSWTPTVGTGLRHQPGSR